MYIRRRGGQRRSRSPFAPSREPERDRFDCRHYPSINRVALSRSSFSRSQVRVIEREPVSTTTDEPAPLPNPIRPVVRPQPTPSLSTNRPTVPLCPPPSSSLSTRRNQSQTTDQSRSQRSSHQSRSQRSSQQNTTPSPPVNPRRRRSMAVGRQATSDETANVLASLRGMRSGVNGRNETIVWHQSDMQGHSYGYGALWSLKGL